MALDFIWIIPVGIGVAIAAYLGISDFMRADAANRTGRKD